MIATRICFMITLYLGRFQGNALLKNCFEDKMHILVCSCIEHWPWSIIFYLNSLHTPLYIVHLY